MPERKIVLLDTGDGSHMELFAPTIESPAEGIESPNDPVTHFALAVDDARAATEIQRMARGMLGRRWRQRELQLRAQREQDAAALKVAGAAVVVIQRFARGWLARRLAGRLRTAGRKVRVLREPGNGWCRGSGPEARSLCRGSVRPGEDSSREGLLSGDLEERPVGCSTPAPGCCRLALSYRWSRQSGWRGAWSGR